MIALSFHGEHNRQTGEFAYQGDGMKWNNEVQTKYHTFAKIYISTYNKKSTVLI